MLRFAVFLTIALPLTHSTSTFGDQPSWPQWRGPQGDGHWKDELPTHWNASDVAWLAPLPGVGQSSPVVSGGRIFLTGAEGNGARRLVFCVDAESGKLLWQRVAWEGEPEVSHQMNMWASATCVTDGQRVIAFFGKGGLHCFSVDGELLWKRTDLGDFVNRWGTASSPVIVDDLLIQNCESEQDSYLLAVNKEDGQTRWQTPRERLRGWSSPLIVSVNGRREIVLNGESGAHGYDLTTGKRLWFCQGDTGRGSPTVTPAGELLVVVNGRPGDMFAVKAGGQGQVNKTHEVWRTKRRGGRDLPSPIVLGEHLIVVNLRPGDRHPLSGGDGQVVGRAPATRKLLRLADRRRRPRVLPQRGRRRVRARCGRRQAEIAGGELPQHDDRPRDRPRVVDAARRRAAVAEHDAAVLHPQLTIAHWAANTCPRRPTPHADGLASCPRRPPT